MISFFIHVILVFYFSLSSSVYAAEESSLLSSIGKRRGYTKGELVPVTCLNRTIETGEHITDAHGNLQYIPFPTCNETSLPLSFPYGTPQSQTCTIDYLPDELYHLIEFFVHSDVPLTCRVPSYPLSQETNGLDSAGSAGGLGAENRESGWTPFTIALQGTLQLSHMHLHTNINVLFHTSTVQENLRKDFSHLIASTAYSLPNTTSGASIEGSKVIRNEPLVLVFNVGWIDGAVLPGMVGRPVVGVMNHNIGFSLLSFFAIAASAGTGAILMLVFERRKSGRSMNGLLGGNIGNGAVGRSTGYGGYGGYGGYNTGKRD